MANTATKAFQEFRDALALTAKQRRKLRERRRTVRGYLAEDWAIADILFGGSHARGTKIRRVEDKQGDVDIYVILADDHRFAYDGLFAKEPKELLSDVKTTLDRHLTTPSIRADSPSVRIRYSDMDVDVIPAFKRFWSQSLDIPYYGRWMVATPRSQEEVFNKLNAAQGYRFKHLVRMVKHWRAVHPSVGLRSYHLEVLAYEIFRRNELENYRYGMRTFFEKAADHVLYSWSDPGGSGNDVAGYMTTVARSGARAMFQTAAQLADAAITTSTWREEIERWRSPRLLGSRFPAWTSE